MLYFFSGLIERIFVRYLSSTKPPKNQSFSFYVGKTTQEILQTHNKGIVMNPTDGQRSVIEIRFDDGTLLCDMYKDVCIDARLFRDKEPTLGPVLSESNHLQN